MGWWSLLSSFWGSQAALGLVLSARWPLWSWSPWSDEEHDAAVAWLGKEVLLLRHSIAEGSRMGPKAEKGLWLRSRG